MFAKKISLKDAYKISRGKTFSKTNVSNIMISVITEILEIDDEEDVNVNLTLAELNATDHGFYYQKNY